MSVYERSVRVDAGLERVWEFHSNGDGLEALTPDWMNLVIEESRGPDGGADPEVLEQGSVIVSSVRPFGVGPRQTWTSEIVAREEGEDHAMFRDVMTEGPFAHWEHTHRFIAEGESTLIHDRVEYQFPGGPLGKAIGPFAWVGFEPMFRHRHKTTKRLLE